MVCIGHIALVALLWVVVVAIAVALHVDCVLSNKSWHKRRSIGRKRCTVTLQSLDVAGSK